MTSVAMLSLWLLLGTSPEPAPTAPVEAMAVEAVDVAAEAAAAAAAAAPEVTGYRDATGSTLSHSRGLLRVTMRRDALRPLQGYWAVDVVLHNQGPKALPVRLSFQPSAGEVSHTVERRVEVGARQRVVVWLPLPIAWYSGQLTIEAAGLDPIVDTLYPDSDRSEPVLVLGTPKSFESAVDVPKNEDAADSLLAARFIEDLVDAPRDLALYAGFRAVMLTGEPSKLPAEVWAALESYVMSGGRLVITRPARGLETYLPLWKAGSSPTVPYGFGSVVSCATPGLECQGLVREVLSRDPADPMGPVNPVGIQPHMSMGSDLVPLLSSARAPLGRFLLLISAFALLAGPGAWMLARRRGPLAVLLAVPVVSAVTCLAIIAWSVLVDGFALHTARYSLTWLDGARSRAATVGLGAWYANLSPEPLKLPVSTVMLPPVESAGELADMDWTGGLTMGSGFVPSRTYREWGEVAVVPSRIRLVAKREGDSVRVQNALGAPLEEGFVRLGGTLWRVPALKEGEEGTGTPEAEPEADNVAHALVSRAFEAGVERRLWGAVQSFRADLVEGEFIARVGGPGPMPSSSMPAELNGAAHLIRGEVRP
ncbi:hypothetical protein MYSTI_07086 [Myxococcus stipitatus DSM 14675]|uniref:Uncharacterized protein n=1 Tax=Myxococcus stipitatus (strain DSM 14675 / JCM 12634 / Mx s8) TaxID=1278073 RepID=L7UK29_MYXSD|nr:hypothetical protein [Myxococcus stipitatus]AGC48358.1 hypothetical protein MYSTI_07086 [Myxococcus stipitatus DSM 14675]